MFLNPAFTVVSIGGNRLPEFDEGLAVPVSEVPKNAAVVWISHCWGGTPARPDDQANGKAKAIYEGLKVCLSCFTLWVVLQRYPMYDRATCERLKACTSKHDTA